MAAGQRADLFTIVHAIVAHRNDVVYQMPAVGQLDTPLAAVGLTGCIDVYAASLQHGTIMTISGTRVSASRLSTVLAATG